MIWFKRKIKRGHKFSKEERKRGIEYRQMKARLNHLENIMEMQDRISAMEDYVLGDEEPNEENNPMENKIIEFLFSNSNKNNNSQQQLNNTEQDYNDEELKGFINMIPKKNIKLIRALPQSSLNAHIGSFVPNISQKSKERLITLLKV